MTRVARIRTPLLAGITALAFCLMWTIPADAQSPTVTVGIDKSELMLGDTVTLTLTVSGGISLVTSVPSFSYIDGFRVLDKTSDSESAFPTASVEFSYTLQAVDTGSLVIGPISITVNGKEYLTDPIAISVGSASGGSTVPVSPDKPPVSSPPGLIGNDLFAEAVVDNDSPYIGEQIYYILRLYSDDGVSHSPSYLRPDFAGFRVARESDSFRYVHGEAGRNYLVTGYSTTLFPLITGDITIEPATLVIFGGFSGVSIEIDTEPVTLRVKPLPLDEPPSFTGAVGRFGISAKVDSPSVDAGSPLELSVTISGEGNIPTLAPPKWPNMKGWRALDSDSDYQTLARNGKEIGMKRFERTLVPSQSGMFEIPPIEYSYFDPDIEQYVTITTEAIPIEALPNAAAAGSDDSDIADDSQSAVGTDIRYIKPNLGELIGVSAPIVSMPSYWVAWSVPAIAIAAAFVWRQIVRRRNALAVAMRPAAERAWALTVVRRLGGSGAVTVDEAANAVHSYLRTVLAVSTVTMSPSQVAALLIERGVTEDTGKRIEWTLADLDERFAPDWSVGGRIDASELADAVERTDAELST